MFLTLKNESADADGWIKNGRYMLFDNVPSLGNLMNFDWYANPSLIEEVLYCVVNLVSYNGANYTTPCLEMLVNCFIPKQIADQEGDLYYNLELANKICDCAHRTCQKIMQVVPLSAPIFCRLLETSFPHKRHDITIQQMYFKNILLASQYCPNHVESLLRLAINRLIQLDVDIKLEDIPEDEDLQFDVEMDKVNEAHLLAEKLDSLMEIMFVYLDAMLGVTSPSTTGRSSEDQPFTVIHNSSSQDQTFAILLRIFDELILSTHKSKYTQFLIFYACRIEKRTYTQRFIGHLLGKIMDVSSPPSVRLASAAYVGSFVARARYLPIVLVRDALAVLSEWAVKYQANQGTQGVPDADMHGLFYMASQSMFYLFCFHHAALMKNGNLVAFGDPFRLISQSSLNPFKMCLPSVVKEFSRIVGTLRWFASDEILAKNERIILSSKTSFGGVNQLESFFPFDPYLLRNSSKFIADHYNVWKSTTEDDDKTDDSDSESDGESMGDDELSENEGVNSNNTSMSFTSDPDLKLGFSLE